MGKELNLIINMSELGAGTRGASMGYGALQVAARNAKSEFFSKYSVHELATDNHLLDQRTRYGNAKYVDGIARVFKRVAEQVKDTLDNNSFPVVIAGDHASAGGTIAGLKQSYPNKRIGVVWIDAHADLHSPFTSVSGNVHGMPLATVLGLDHKELALHDVEPQEYEFWSELKNAAGVSPMIKYQDLVFVGVRDTEVQEDDIIAKYGIESILVDQVRNKGALVIADHILKHLQECDLIYVSFDVDSMDCEEVSRGTGTPVENGLTEEECTTLLDKLVQDPKVCCLEMVEINPCLDNKSNVMAETAFRILESAIQNIHKQF